jgi:hypothetical protein
MDERKHPEAGFLSSRWNRYCELMMIYLLALGSPTHPVPPTAWNAFTRPTITFQGIEYISGNDPLFTHQYSHAWFDFRHKRDAYADHFENSVKAARAHKEFCLLLHDEFPDYSERLWGITASDSRPGYRAWGGLPRLRGFVDAFDPLVNWYDPYVIGIDVGITMLMAENQRTGFVYETFMKNKEAQRGMRKAGFHSS